MSDWLDQDGYPTDEALEHIKTLGKLDGDIKARTEEFIAFVRSIWHWPEWGFHEREGENIVGRKCRVIELHTGGWSGNESVIDAMHGTFFWFFYWRRSDCGGHFYFELPVDAPKEKGE